MSDDQIQPHDTFRDVAVGLAFARMGKRRPPLEGEWFLSRGEAHRASFDFSTEQEMLSTQGVPAMTSDPVTPPTEAEVERIIRRWETNDHHSPTSEIAVVIAYHRANVRPAPPDPPEGETLLMEDGVPVFREPEEGERWLGMERRADGWRVSANAFSDLLALQYPDCYGGRRYILAPRKTARELEVERLAEALGGAEGYSPASASRVAERLDDRGVRCPEEATDG